MPPKKIEERNLQAVVLCDSYLPRFLPLTSHKPRCLLPLANTPLIEYTLEFLVSAKVSEVYLMCCAHADQVTEYIEKSKWSSPYSPFKVTTIELPNTLSVGDAMRDLDGRRIIKSDFLLISGDVVCNVDFAKVWAAHIKRKQQDKNCIMSIVLRKAAPRHRTRSSKTGLYILDSETNRLVGYKASTMDRQVSVDAGEVLKLPQVSFRNDLIDCYIDICTPDVPALFQENFDYEYIRKDFVNGILTSDILGKTIYAHILDNDYAARVESFRTYDSVTRDIVSRYTYPLVVDSMDEPGMSYDYRQGHIYIENDVVLSQSCTLGKCVVVGARTFLGETSYVDSSVIGRNCKIGSNVQIRGSYIWDNVVIHDNAVLDRCVVGNNAVIGAGCVLEPGCVVDVDYHLEAGTTVPKQTRLYSGDAQSESESEDDESDAQLLASTLEGLDLSDDSISSVKSSDRRRARKTARSLSTTSAVSAAGEDDEEDFFKEAVASINRSIVDNHAQDVAMLELNTLRMTMNASHEQVPAAVVHALISHIGHLVTQADVKTATVGVFEHWTPLLKRVTFDFDGQVVLARDIEIECAKRLHGEKILFYAISTLYDTDVISEEAIYKWWGSEGSGDKVRAIVGQWVEWLQNAEEESEESD